jgi:hypothetical protein
MCALPGPRADSYNYPARGNVRKWRVAQSAHSRAIRSVPVKTSVQISRAPGQRPSPEQERFRFLIRQVEQAQLARAACEAKLLKFRQEHTTKMQPLRAEFASVCRAQVRAMDALLDQSGWSRAERSTLREMLCENAEALLSVHGADAELQALFDKHSEIDYETTKRAELEQLKAHTEDVTGVELGDEDGIHTEDDLVQRVYEKMKAAHDAQEEIGTRRRKHSGPADRAIGAAQLAKQSLREIYRKLASAVHPDREPDPHRRADKTALMQRINQAYAANDLLSLFQMQMQLEHIDADHLAKVSAQRLKQYNKLLAEQLSSIKSAIGEMETGWCMDFGLERTSDLSPQHLRQFIVRQARRLRAEIAREQQFLTILANKTGMRRWLKQRDRFARGDDDDDDA